MKSVSLLFTILVIVASSNFAFAQRGTSTQRGSFSQIQDHYVSDAEHALVPVAEAMPENKYSFAPSNGEFKGVRTFSDMVKHAAASNYGMAGAILHENPPVKLETEADLDAITTKATRKRVYR